MFFIFRPQEILFEEEMCSCCENENNKKEILRKIQEIGKQKENVYENYFLEKEKEKTRVRVNFKRKRHPRETRNFGFFINGKKGYQKYYGKGDFKILLLCIEK